MRRFIRLHLLTLALLAVTAGILLGLNIRGIHAQAILAQSVVIHANSYMCGSQGCVRKESTHFIQSLCYVECKRPGWPYELNVREETEEAFFYVEVPEEFNIPPAAWPWAIEDSPAWQSTFVKKEELLRRAPKLLDRIYSPPQSVICPETSEFVIENAYWNGAICSALLILLAVASEFLQRRRRPLPQPLPATLSPA